jgi:hypothetical protein
MPITRTPIIDDDGSGRTGTVLDNAWKQELYNQIDGYVGGGGAIADNAERIGVPTTGNATIALGAGKSIHILDCTNAALLTILGTTGGTQKTGDRLIIRGQGAGAVQLAHNGGGANQGLFNFITSAPTPVSSQGAAEYVYDGGWALVAHDQGASLPFTPTLSFGGGAVGIAYSVRVGAYVVKGVQVKVFGRVTLSAKGSSAGAIVLGGFPFNVHPTLYSSIALAFFGGWLALPTAGSNVFGYFQPNAASAALVTPNAGATVAVTDANASGGVDMVFDGTYITT